MRRYSWLLFPAIAIPMLCSQAIPASSAPAASALAQMPPGTHLGSRLAANESLSFALTLPVSDPAGLATFLKRVYDPQDSLYGHYLTPQEFADRFGPSRASYQALQNAAAAEGLAICRTYANRLVLDVRGPARVVESLLSVHLYHVQGPDGRVYHVADGSPAVSGPLAALGVSIVGLDDTPAARTHIQATAMGTPSSGPVGLEPSDIRQVYDIPATDAPSQTVALLELDGYDPSDIQAYRDAFGIVGTPVRIISVDGATNTPGSNADEVVLDIELVLALDQDGAGILVYQGPNTSQGALDAFSQIASDNAAQLVSSSWGVPEGLAGRGYITTESQVFAEMAAQGQSAFASSGDDGAFDNGKTLSVDDPASQPMVTGVGGTSLTRTSSGGYGSESTWNNSLVDASGGGVSAIWPLPSYQSDASLPGAMRLVPDIAINADPNSGYAFYFSSSTNPAGWYFAGGTSAGPPLWSGLTAIINQQRAGNGLGPIGFINPAIYNLATSLESYNYDLHDIVSGNNNHYFAAAGYDMTTGWGTPIGMPLIADLSSATRALQAGLWFFAVPYDYTGSTVADIFDQPVTLYNWDPVTDTYVSTPNPPCDTVHQMLGYWANFAATTHLTSAGADLSGGKSETVALEPGWNMIGNPFDVNVPLSDVTISTTGGPMTLAAANANGLVYTTLFSYDPFLSAYLGHESDNLAPYTGYWIKAFSPCNITISHP